MIEQQTSEKSILKWIWKECVYSVCVNRKENAATPVLSENQEQYVPLRKVSECMTNFSWGYS